MVGMGDAIGFVYVMGNASSGNLPTTGNTRVHKSRYVLKSSLDYILVVADLLRLRIARERAAG